MSESYSNPSEEERLDAYLNPANTMVSEDYINRHKDDVLKFLSLKGTSYPSEIASSLGMHHTSATRILGHLRKLKYIRRLIPNRWHPQPPLAVRLTELSQAGLDSYFKINRCDWWIITREGLIYLKTHYKGQKIQMSKALIEYSGFKIKS